MCALAAWPVAVRCAQPSFGGALQLTQDYVSKGLSQTCGDPAGQVDLHIRLPDSHQSAAGFAGLWGSAGLGQSRCGSSKELDIYAGGSLLIAPGANLTLTYTHYSFPGGNYVIPRLRGERYDYDEFDALWVFKDRVAVSLGWTADALSKGYPVAETDRHALDYAIEVRQPVGFQLTLSASAGYDRIVDPEGTGYGFWSVGVNRSWGAWQLDLSFFRASPRAVREFGKEAAGSRVAASASWRF
jgi:uncharacterized protein (TIGR02001 family)